MMTKKEKGASGSYILNLLRQARGQAAQPLAKGNPRGGCRRAVANLHTEWTPYLWIQKQLP